MLNAVRQLREFPPIDRSLLTLALTGMAGLVIWFFLTPTQIWPADPIATIKASGPIKRRQSRSLEWGTIRDAGTIYRRDTVFTPPGVSSTVTFFNRTALRLEPNSMVQFDEIDPNRLDVVLLKGNVASLPLAQITKAEKGDKSEIFSLHLPKIKLASELIEKITTRFIPTAVTPSPQKVPQPDAFTLSKSDISKPLTPQRQTPMAQPKTTPLTSPNTLISQIAPMTTPPLTSITPLPLKTEQPKMTLVQPEQFTTKVIQPQTPVLNIDKIKVVESTTPATVRPIATAQPAANPDLPPINPPISRTLSSNRPAQIVIQKQDILAQPIAIQPPALLTQRSAQRHVPLALLQRVSLSSASKDIYLLDRPDYLFTAQAELLANTHTYKRRMLSLAHPPRLTLRFSSFELNNLNEYNIIPLKPATSAVAQANNDCVMLLWSPVPIKNIGYYLEISRDSQFRYVRSYGSGMNEVGLRLNDNAETYYWRVRAVMGDDSLISTLTNFKINRSGKQHTKQFDQKEKSQLPEWEVCYGD